MARTRTFNKAEILDKAVNLFWEKGYNATSANDLVSVLGLSRSSLYGTYGNKKSLYLMSLQKYHDVVIERFVTTLRSSKSLKKGVNEVFKESISQDLSTDDSKGCFMVNAGVELPHDEEVMVLVTRSREVLELAFKDAVKKAVKSGEISKKHKSKHLAKFLFNSLSGIRVSTKYHKDKASYNEIIGVINSLLF